jgi:hypothetical protein
MISQVSYDLILMLNMRAKGMNDYEGKITAKFHVGDKT